MESISNLELVALVFGLVLIFGGFVSILSSFNSPDQGRYDFFIYVICLILGIALVLWALLLRIRL